MKTIEVLVIEDHPNDITFLQQLVQKLSDVKINISVGTSLSEGRNILFEKDIQVILLGFSLRDVKEIDGLDEIVKLYPHLPVVILSDFDDQEISWLAIKVGAQDFLVKEQITEHSLLRSMVFAIQRKEKEQQLEYWATHDHLTNLPNRWLFGNRLNRGIKRFYRKTDALSLAILFVDLDNFKQVNDTYGHQAGDTVLSSVALRLKNRLRENDTVSRIGGDEFAVILEGITEEGIGVRVAEELLNLINLPFEIENQSIAVSACIGISYYPQHGQDVALLLERADQAMYKAKISENKIQVYMED